MLRKALAWMLAGAVAMVWLEAQLPKPPKVREPIVIAGMLNWRYSHFHGKFVDVRVQTVERHYLIKLGFIANLKEGEEWVKGFNGRRVVIKGELEPKDYRPGFNYIAVDHPEGIRLQEPLTLTGTVAVEGEKDVLGDVSRVFLVVGERKYLAAGLKAKERLTLARDQRVKVKCWMDGDEKQSLRIAEIIELERLPAPE